MTIHRFYVAKALLFGCFIALLHINCARTRFAPEGDPQEDIVGCTTDEDCEDGYICVFGECVPVEEFNCTGNQQPVVHLETTQIEFRGVLAGERANRSISISNIGPCNLEIESAGISDSGSSGFACSPCDPTLYPNIVPPNHSTSIDVSYIPTQPGQATSALYLRTSDYSAGQEGLITVDLKAYYEGIPALRIAPPELNFGYVPFINGSQSTPRTETIRVTNVGTGNAELEIQFIYIRPGTDFSIPEEFTNVSPGDPIRLAPFDQDNPNTWIDIPLTFLPTSHSDQETTLVVHAAPTSQTSEPAVASTRIAASSLGPPNIVVTPLELDFRDESNTPLALGRTASRTVFIQNTGQSELTLDLDLDDPSGDFSFSPSFVAPLLPGGTIAINVLYNPTQPSDPAHPSDPQRSSDGWLRIISNDNENVLTSVNLHGWAQTTTSDDTLRIEMTFENNDGGWAQDDFRNVDLELISPLGFSCKKPAAQYVQDRNGTYVVADTTDFCQMWSDTGLEGNASWIPVGVFEEPERVILYGLGPNLADGGSFDVRAHYIDDCANIPAGFIGDLTGIGVSTLLGILGAEIGVPISVSPDAIGNLINENCWTRESSLVTITAFVNTGSAEGTSEVFSKQIRLNNRGDVQSFFRVVRENGRFVIRE